MTEMLAQVRNRFFLVHFKETALQVVAWHPDMATYGYARVSSTDQDYDGQVERLKAAGCERVFSEKVSGKSQDGRGR